jgi:hypothetical protein
MCNAESVTIVKNSLCRWCHVKEQYTGYVKILNDRFSAGQKENEKPSRFN